MDSSRGIRRMKNLAQQLRSYKPPPSHDNDTEEEDEKKILGSAESTVSIHRQPNYRSKRAAVLICLFEGEDGDLRVILTKRASNLTNHPGEISLPGGMVDGGDADYCQTALREAKEEIGLDPWLVEVVTVLQPFLSMQLNKVTPVIGMLFNKRAFDPVINTTEVDAVFDVPLEMFLKDENHRTEVHEWMGVMYRLHFFDFQSGNEKYVIWGITSGILIRAASVIYQRPPPFDEQKPYFKIGNL